MKRLITLLILAAVPALAQQQQYAAYVNPGTGWAPWTAASGSGQIGSTPIGVYLFCQAAANGPWSPCTGSSGGGTYTGTPNQVDVTGTVISLDPNLQIPGTSALYQVPGIAFNNAGGFIQSATIAPLTYVATGDSITAGFYATLTCNQSTATTSCDYVSLLGYDLNAAVTNRGITGSFCADVATQQVFNNQSPTLQRNPAFTVMCGTNEYNYKGTGAYEVNYIQALSAIDSWMAIPAPSKVLGQACTLTNFTADSTYQTGIDVISTTNGATAVCPITLAATGPVYAWYQQSDTSGGVFTYQLDSGATTSITIAPVTPIATNNTRTVSIGLIRIPGVTAGAHNINFAVTSATGAGNQVMLLGVGSVPQTIYYGAPRVFQGGVPRQNGDANSAGTAQYNADALAVQQQLAGDGLPVNFVNVRNYLCTNPNVGTVTCYNSAGVADMTNQLHPNNQGYTELRDAWEDAMQYSPVPPYPATPQTYIAPSASSASAYTYSGTVYKAGNATTNTPYFYWDFAPTSEPTSWNTNGALIGWNAPASWIGDIMRAHINGGASIFSVDFAGDILGAGALTMTGAATATRFTSNVAQGTAPLVVTSTTPVPNLNAALNSSAEVVASSATPTFSVAFSMSRNVLTANVTSFTMAAGADGQAKTLCFKQGAGPFTVAAPANVHGFFTVGITNADWNCQSYRYDVTDSIWLAISTGVINQ